MNSLIYSTNSYSLDGQRIAIECHLSNGLPSITIVGMGNKSVEEAKERIRGAFSSSLLQIPRKHIILNLAPADVPKEGSSLDLAMATSILLADQQIKINTSIKRLVIYGELGLSGEVRPIKGIISRLVEAKKYGATLAIIPASNYRQAQLVDGITLVPVSNIKDVLSYFNDAYTPVTPKAEFLNIDCTPDIDFSEVVGQLQARRAAEIAAAGAHNLLLDGPPGSGKSMIAKALRGILPPLSKNEIAEVTQLHSLGLGNVEHIVTTRPFQAPHHSTSAVAILGGGQSPRPGAVSLSHKGILFLDELPEFGRYVIDSLRQPLEDKKISISRAKVSLEFPADCILVATRNPCPCGYYGSKTPCTCQASHIINYQKRISGPVLDRIDLYVNVEAIEHDKLLSTSQAEPSSKIVERVIKARQIQAERFKNTSKTNSLMTNKDILALAQLNDSSKALLNTAAQKLSLSARSYMRVIKVARTIADLEDSRQILSKHIAEALQYRAKPFQL